MPHVFPDDSASTHEGRVVLRVRQCGRAWELVHPRQPLRRFHDPVEAFERAEHLALAHRRESGMPTGVVFEIPGAETLAARFD
mgnify:CR=1 FL=1